MLQKHANVTNPITQMAATSINSSTGNPLLLSPPGAACPRTVDWLSSLYTMQPFAAIGKMNKRYVIMYVIRQTQHWQTHH